MRKLVFGAITGVAALSLLRAFFPLLHDRTASTEPVSFAEYWPLLGAVPLLVFGARGLSLRDSVKDRQVETSAPRGQWYEIKPKYPLRHRTRLAAITAALWNLVALPVSIDFFRAGGGDDRPIGIAVCILFLLAGAALAIIAVQRLVMDSRFRHVHVEATRMPLVLGKPVTIRVEQEFGRRLHPAMLRVGLICLRTGNEYGPMGIALRVVEKPYSEQWREVMVNQHVEPMQRLVLERSLEVPADAPPTSPAWKKKEPWFIWQIWVHVAFNDGPTFRMQFPVTAGELRDHAPEKEKPDSAARVAGGRSAPAVTPGRA